MKHLFYYYLVVFLSIQSFYFHVQGGQCSLPLPQKYQSLQHGDIVAAYIGSWDIYHPTNHQIEDIEPIAHRLTHIIYAFMKPNDQKNRCEPHDIWADLGGKDYKQSQVGGNFGKLIALKQKFPHLKILLSVGGGTYNKNFIKIAQSKHDLKKFARSCVSMLDFYDYEFKPGQINRFNYQGLFDGIDIDWEWDTKSLTPLMSKRFTFFIHELRRLLDIRDQKTDQNSMLSVALQVVPHVYQNLDFASLVDKVDWFDIMAYNFFGPLNEKIGFSAPICSPSVVYSVAGAIDRIIQQGVSPDKMVLGLPLYGYLYENCSGYNTKIDTQTIGKTIAYNVIKDSYVDHPHFIATWHTKGQVPSLYNPHQRVFISYDSIDSIAKKVELAKEKRLAGLVLWRLSGDDQDYSIVHTVANRLHE